jgi:hypothetical protein
MKKIITSLILLSYFPTTFAEVIDTCEYKGELEQCIQANAK